MASPSLALLSALVSATRRPTHLLLQEGAAPSASNTARILGAVPIDVPLSGLEAALQILLASEEVSPELVWAVTAHRPGAPSPVDWLVVCASKGVPTVDLCLGGVAGLAERGPSPATFSIVDLDADPAFAGLHLTALLTDSTPRAQRVRAMCLPSPRNRDYVLDAAPRGVDADEARLAGLMEKALSQFAGAEAWSSLPEEQGAGTAEIEWDPEMARAAAEAENDALAARLAEAERERDTALAMAKAETDALVARLGEVEKERERDFAQALEQEVMHRSVLREERQRAADLKTALAALTSRGSAQAKEWEEVRLEFLEREALHSSELREARRRIADQETALAAVPSRESAQANDFEAARAEFLEREAMHRSALRQEQQRTASLEMELSAMTSRGAAKASEWEAMRAEFLERIARLTGQAVLGQTAQAALQAEKAHVERSMALLETESESLSERLAQVERDRDEAMADAARRDLTSRSQKKKWTAADRKRQGALDDADMWFKAQAASLARAEERAAGLQRELAASAERHASQGRDWQSDRLELSERLLRVEAALAAAEESHRDGVFRNKEAEHSLSAMRARSDALALKLTEAESARDAALTAAAMRQEAHHEAQDEQRRQGQELRDQLTMAAARQAQQLREWESSRSDLADRIARLESAAVFVENAHTDLLAERMQLERSLESARSEREALAERLAVVEAERDRLAAETSRREQTEPAHQDAPR